MSAPGKRSGNRLNAGDGPGGAPGPGGDAVWLNLAGLAIILTLLVTAIPAHVRPPKIAQWEWHYTVADVVANVALYFPFGLFLRSAGLMRVAGLSLAISTAVELIQLFFVGRVSQPLDVGANVLGAVAGRLLGRTLSASGSHIAIGPAGGLAAVTAAVAWTAVCPVISNSYRPYLPWNRVFRDWLPSTDSPLFGLVQAGFVFTDLGGPANAALAGFIAAAGAVGVLRPRRRTLLLMVAAIAGLCVGSLIRAREPLFWGDGSLFGGLGGLAIVACSRIRISGTRFGGRRFDVADAADSGEHDEIERNKGV